jgi:lipopolysaccharide export system permease protein
MKLIDRHILRNFLVPFFYILVSLLGFFLVYDVSSKTARFLKQQVSMLAIVKFYSLYIPQLIALGLPMVVLVSVVVGVGRMSRNNEVTAMRASGVSVLRIVRPVFAVGLLLAGISFTLFEKVVTRTFGEAREFELALKGQKKATSVISGGDLLTDDSGSLLLFDKYRRKEKRFESISWEKVTQNPKGKMVVTASKAEWKGDSWWAFGVRVAYPDDTHSPLYSKMKMYEWDFRPEDVLGKRWPEQMSLRELGKNIRRYRFAPQKARTLQTQLHRRLALPLLNPIAIAIALPFALKPRKGRGSTAIGVGICILVCASYYGLSVALSLPRAVPPWVATWLPNLLFGAGGATATVRIE